MPTEGRIRSRALLRTLAARGQMAAVGTLAAAFVGQGALAVSGIVLARILGPENRGYFALFVLLPLVISQVGEMGLPVASAYCIARDPRTTGAVLGYLRRWVPGQCLALVAVHAVVVFALFWSRPEEVRVAALITLVLVPAGMAQEYGLAVMQGQQRFVAFNVLRIAPLAANAFLALFIWSLRTDLIATTAMLTGSAIAAGATTLGVALRGQPRPQPARDSTPAVPPSGRLLLSFGVRSFIGSLYPGETYRPEQILVGLLISPAALGIYVSALAFNNLPRFLAQSLGMVAYPRVAETDSVRRGRRLVWGYFWASIALAGAVLVALELLVPYLVPLLFGGRFAAAIPVARVLFIGGFFLSARRILAEGLKGAGFPAAGTLAEVASWLALAAGLVVLMTRFGLIGVAVAVTASGAFSLAVLLLLEATTLRGRSPTDRRLLEEALPAGR